MKILFVSLGCDKNLVDTEKMMRLLSDGGFEFAADETDADVVVVNTCCFIGDAKQESINELLKYAEMKKSGAIKALVASGCLAERYKEEIRNEIPEVDALVGTNSISGILRVLKQVLDKTPEDYFVPLTEPTFAEPGRIPTTYGHYAYLKIADGCNKHCTYCVIPSIRGPFRSIPKEKLIEESKALAARGVKEIIIIAQETAEYGIDLYGSRQLHTLIREISMIEGIHWIRVMYCYPEEIYDELIEEIKTNDKVVKYLDLPIQHASDSILGRMGRKTSMKDIEALIKRLRDEIPEICLRTSLISGFPGETKADFTALYEFLGRVKLDRVGVFTYSREEGTPAAGMPRQIFEFIKKSRRKKLMLLQQGISLEKTESFVGKTLEVMVEGYIAEDDVYVARTYRDAPDVDGFIFFKTEGRHETGDMVNVLVTTSKEYDMIGEEVYVEE